MGQSQIVGRFHNREPFFSALSQIHGRRHDNAIATNHANMTSYFRNDNKMHCYVIYVMILLATKLLLPPPSPCKTLFKKKTGKIVSIQNKFTQKHATSSASQRNGSKVLAKMVRDLVIGPRSGTSPRCGTYPRCESYIYMVI